MPEESPLGIRPFASYRFAATPYQLALSASAYRENPSAEVRALLKIGERESVYEARVQLIAQDRPVHRIRLYLPDSLKLDQVDCLGGFDWAETKEAGRRLLTVYLAEGRQGEFFLDIRGTFPFHAGPDAIAAPRLEILDTKSQNGFLVIQADPAYDVRVDKQEHCAGELTQRIHAWLEDDQVATVRAVLSYRRPDYTAWIHTTPLRADVEVLTITNMRVTTREVQQVVYLEYRIQKAGVREVSFVLPVGMEKARIKVRLLREKIIESVEGNPGLFRVRLRLQDEITGQLIVMVEQDRALTRGIHHTPIPIVEESDVIGRFVVLESAGRDEVVIDRALGLTPLNRQQTQWKELAAILGSNITQAYLVREDSPEHQLLIKTRRRTTIEAAGARIGLARTLMVVDGNGAYRAIQEYRVDNKTEQYLEVELPRDAQLWTVFVAGEAVKPTTSLVAGQRNVVQIPLFKTAAGDLDYVVELKYAGQLPPLGTLSKVAFPFPRTINIRPELSQVRLRLPETHRWFDFGGTMRRVKDERDLVAEFLSYKTRQVRELTKLLDMKSSGFKRVRAESNLQQLNLSLQNFRNLQGHTSGRTWNELLEQEFASNAFALQEAERQIEQAGEEGYAYFGASNRDRLLSRYDVQEGKRAKNVVTQLGDNFGQPQKQGTTRQPQSNSEFNSLWFDGAKLGKALGRKKDLDKSRVADRSTKVRARGKVSRRIGQPRSSSEAMKAGLKAPAVADELLGRNDQQKAIAGQAEEQRGGELRQQLERYERKLKEQNAQNRPALGQRSAGRYGLPQAGEPAAPAVDAFG
ncbi:MAG: hypothetical protein ACC628_26145, partial [Pirellulaceae bacterium]